MSNIPPGMKPRAPIGGDSPGLEYYDFTDKHGRYSHTCYRLRSAPNPEVVAANQLAIIISEIKAKAKRR